jgi:acetyl esterase/lipase
MKKVILIALLTTFLTSCASQEDTAPVSIYNPVIAPENENQILDLSYGDDPQQKMDLILPANRKTDVTKVFILIHGGGWFEGDKSEFNNEVIMLRAAFPNYAIANVNYRLGTRESLGFPKQINDIQKIVAFLNSKYKEYHIAKQYAMVGMSAGAHLAMLYSYKYNTNNQVKAVCSLVGPADFSDPRYEGNGLFKNGLNYVVGEYPNYRDNPVIYNTISPAKQITTRSPKTILFYGDVDPLVPNTQGGILKQKLDEKHVYNEYYKYDGAGHANWNSDQYADVNAKTINFFRTYFK